MFRFVLKIYMLWYLCKFKKKAISKALLLVNRQLLFRFVLKICCGNYVKVLKRVNNNHYILFTGGSRGQDSTENLIIHVYLWYCDNLLAFLCSGWWNSLDENTIALSTQSCCECLQRGWVPFSSAWHHWMMYYLPESPDKFSRESNEIFVELNDLKFIQDLARPSCSWQCW